MIITLDKLQRLSDDELENNIFIYKLKSDKNRYAKLHKVNNICCFLSLFDSTTPPTFITDSIRNCILKAMYSREVMMLYTLEEMTDYISGIHITYQSHLDLLPNAIQSKRLIIGQDEFSRLKLLKFDLGNQEDWEEDGFF